MGASFGDAPPEIVDLIVQQLAIQHDRQTLLNLACTCKSLEALCIPLVEPIPSKTIWIRADSIYNSFTESVVRRKVDYFKAGLRFFNKDSLTDYRQLLLQPEYPSWEKKPGPETWDALIELIAELPFLDEFSYAEWRDDGLPTSLFNAVQKYHPHCTFYVQKDAANMVGASLPDPSHFKMLKALGVPGLGIEYGSDKGDESMAKLLDRRAHLRLPGEWDPSAGARRIEYLPCRGVRPDKGRLRIFDRGWLQISHKEDSADLPREWLHYLWIPPAASDPAGLFGWAGVTDLSVLRVLDLDVDVEQGSLELWAGDLQLPSLRTLFLRVTSEARPGESRPVSHYQAVERFLCSLPPLSQMHLSGWHSSVSTPSLVKHHGRRLRTLILSGLSNQYLTETDILSIGANCPVLEDLTLPVRRSQGDAAEVACYKALSTIAPLKHLDLTLSIDEPQVQIQVPSPETTQDPSRTEALRHLLINVAIDETLALSIFHLISPSKTSGASSLERMRITLSKTSLSWFSYPWLIGCDRTFKHARIHATPIKPKREGKQPPKHLSLELEDVFYSIWPQHRPTERKMSKKLKKKREREKERGTAAWVRHWESFPLDVGVGGSGSDTEAPRAGEWW